MHPHWLMCMCILVICRSGFAQNLEGAGNEKPLQISGDMQMTGMGYAANGIEGRRDPLTWIMTANMNFSIYGWNIPFSFSYSNQDAVFRQPFNQYGISPYYKWVKTYLGYHNLTYSSYTLAGHTFLGGAVELTPGKFHFHTMYGRLNKAVTPDTLSSEQIIPAYRRMGVAIKAGYGDNRHAIDIVLFRAVDDETSLTDLADSVVTAVTEILPAENIAFSVLGKTQIAQRFSLHAEWAGSALTRDLRAEKLKEVFFLQNMGGLLTARTSTAVYQAFKSGLEYAANGYALQLHYERVDPGYQTLGAYYFNNDLENFTLGTALQLWQNKLNISAQGGIQKNNLDDTEISSTHRLVSNINVAWMPNEKWNISSSYSNFTSFTNLRPKADPFFQNDFDTLNFYQINQNANVTMSYQFGTKEIRKGILLNTNYQVVNETTTGSASPGNDSNFFSGNMAYRYAIVPTNFSLSAGTSFYQSSIAEMTTFTIGPVVSVSKAFFEKKLRTALTSTYHQVITNREVSSQVLNMRINGTFTLQKRHNFSLNLNTLKKLSVDETDHGFTELTATINYGYSF